MNAKRLKLVTSIAQPADAPSGIAQQPGHGAVFIVDDRATARNLLVGPTLLPAQPSHCYSHAQGNRLQEMPFLHVLVALDKPAPRSKKRKRMAGNLCSSSTFE